MRLGIAAKPDDPQRVKIARYAFDYLKGRENAEVVVQQELAKHFDGEAKGVPLEGMDVDVLVTIGGDGTILHAMQRTHAPVFGINVGELGFLTESEPIELPDALDRLLTRDYEIESRVKLATRVNDEKMPDALNETVVKTARAAKMLSFDLRVNGHPIHRVRADGLIFATPTGSTSYAMSAGGPIVDPRVECLLITPIAAFSLTSRPLVFPTASEVELHLGEAHKDAVLVIDGQHERALRADDRIAFGASSERARFVRFGTQGFYDRLNERLGQG